MSSLWSTDISDSRSPNRFGNKHGSSNSLGGQRSDHVTIFHENGIRQPLDPKLRFCETPGPSLTHEPILDSIKYDGRHRAPSTYLDKNKSSRFADPEPLKEYDPKHNSLHIVKRTKEQFVPKVGHKNPFPGVNEDQRPHIAKGGPMYNTEKETTPWKLKKPTYNLKFDASCYNTVKVPDIIRPSEINRRIKKDAFFRMMTTPVQYNSQQIGTKIDTRRFRGEIS